MADGISWDLLGLDKLAADLGAASVEAAPFVRKAVEVTARHVKDDTRKVVAADKFFKGIAHAIDYDINDQLGGVEAEIGYNKDIRAGRLGNIREYGAPGSPNSVAPHNDLTTALTRNQADFVKGIEIAAADGLKARGL